MKKRTWKIIEWFKRPARTSPVPLDCPHCGQEADLAMCAESVKHIEFASDLNVYLDPHYQPVPGYTPDVVECRKCGSRFGTSSANRSYGIITATE